MWFICLDTSQETPWSSIAGKSVVPGMDIYGQPMSKTDADKRVARLNPMWLHWQLNRMAQLAPPEFFNGQGGEEETLVKTLTQVEAERCLLVSAIRLRRLARSCGMDPNDVVILEREPTLRLRAGPKLANMTPKEAESLDKAKPLVGTTWAPKDPRRKTRFVITWCSNGYVFGNDRRVVNAKRLRSRYTQL